MRIYLDDRVVVGDGTLEQTFATQCDRAVVKCSKMIRLQLNGTVEIRDCAIKLALVQKRNAAIVDCDVVFWLQTYGLIIVFNRAIDLAIRSKGNAPVVVGGDELDEHPLARLYDRGAAADRKIDGKPAGACAGAPILVGQCRYRGCPEGNQKRCRDSG